MHLRTAGAQTLGGPSKRCITRFPSLSEQKISSLLHKPSPPEIEKRKNSILAGNSQSGIHCKPFCQSVHPSAWSDGVPVSTFHSDEMLSSIGEGAFECNNNNYWSIPKGKKAWIISMVLILGRPLPLKKKLWITSFLLFPILNPLNSPMVLVQSGIPVDSISSLQGDSGRSSSIPLAPCISQWSHHSKIPKNSPHLMLCTVTSPAIFKPNWPSNSSKITKFMKIFI